MWRADGVWLHVAEGAMRAALAALLLLTLVGCGETPPSDSQIEVDRYTAVCRETGGFVGRVPEFSNFIYTCVGQTTGPHLPEFRR